VSYKVIVNFLKEKIKLDENIDSKLQDLTILYRWSTLNDRIEKNADNIYKVDTSKNNINQLKGLFYQDVFKALEKKYKIESLKTHCTLDPTYGNFNKQENRLYIVVPINNFFAFQTPLAKDIIELGYSNLPKKLRQINKPYIAKAIEHAEKDFTYSHGNFNILNNNYGEFQNKRPDAVKAIIDTIVNSYTCLKDKQYYNSEVLLYCNSYLLIDNDFFKQRLGIK